MALVGDVISEAGRQAALRDIARVLDRAGRIAADEAPALVRAHARAPFTIAETDPALLSSFIDRFRAAALWVDEGNCFNRAMLGVHMLDEMRGFGSGPVDDVFAGAIAVKRNHVGAGYVAEFHAAAAVRLAHVDEPHVLDLVPGSPTLQPLSAWAPGEVPVLLRPFAGTGIGGRSDWVGPSYFGQARDLLSATWAAADRHGVTVRGAGVTRTATARA